MADYGEKSLSIDKYCPSISWVEAGFEQEIIQLAGTMSMEDLWRTPMSIDIMSKHLTG